MDQKWNPVEDCPGAKRTQICEAIPQIRRSRIIARGVPFPRQGTCAFYGSKMEPGGGVAPRGSTPLLYACGLEHR